MTENEKIAFDEIAERFVGSISYNTISSIATQKEKFEELCELIKAAKTIITAGEGRSKLAADFFGLRLGHVFRAFHKMKKQQFIEKANATAEIVAGAKTRNAKIKLDTSEISQIIHFLCEMNKENEEGVYSMYDINVPPISKNCLVIILSGSGETNSQIEKAKEVKKIGAKLVVLTSYPKSTIGRMANLLITVPGRNATEESESLLPMGTKFEVTVSDVLEILIAYILRKEKIPPDMLKEMHRNV